ncbi:MAG TPA: hypothetical protein VIH45_12575 [Desulfuromonadaceae bacterium]
MPTLDALLALEVERPLTTKKDLREMKEYLAVFDETARKLTAQGQDGGAVTAALLQKLPKRSLAEWMVGFNVKARYLDKGNVK